MINIGRKEACVSKRVVDAIESVVGGQCALHEPQFSGNEWSYLKDCLESTFVSSVGRYVDRFESQLSDFTGSKFVVATVNGTSALHIALLISGVKQDDEVLVPSLTFVATANAVSYCSATPHFVDSEIGTLGIDPSALDVYLRETTKIQGNVCLNKNTGKVIRAMIPMHTFGHPSDMQPLCEIAKKYKILVIEDAAESLGSYYFGKHTGTFGDVGTLSFNGNKTITTGGGGAILTDNAEVAQRARSLVTTAKRPHAWEYFHNEVAYNYRMPNINAALGCAQLEQLPGFLLSKRKLFEKYKNAFSSVPGTAVVAEPEGCESNYWLQAILLDESIAHCRDLILEKSNEAGFMTRPVWCLLHRLPHFNKFPHAPLETAEYLEKSLLNIPSSPFLAHRK